MTIKPVQEIKKKRSTAQSSQDEARASDENFPEDNSDQQIGQDRLKEVVFPYHFKPTRSALKKISLAKNSDTSIQRPQSNLQVSCNEGLSANVIQNQQAICPPNPTEEEECSGYNSGDEHRPVDVEIDWKKRDEDFENLLKQKGFAIKEVDEDGACLFRAIAAQIYGDENMHDMVRQLALDYIQKNRDYFSSFMTEDIDEYIKRKRDVKAHGNHIELQAISEVFNRPIELYAYEAKPINIFNSDQMNNGYPPLRLSYQRNNHYNAIIDPYNATVGVGLGLPGLKPTMQTADAIKISEEIEIEKTMLEDKLKTTDWEATNEAMEEQIARESYLQWLQESLKRNKKHEPTATVTSSSAQSDPIFDLGIDVNNEISKPSTSKANVIEINPFLLPFNNTHDLDDYETAAKKPLKSKGEMPKKNTETFDAKRFCDFDLSKSDENLSEHNSKLLTEDSATDNLPSTSKQNVVDNDVANMSQKGLEEKGNLYEELLQASLAFGEDNDSEMFQRVLQMSTEEFVLEQSRKNSSLT